MNIRAIVNCQKELLDVDSFIRRQRDQRHAIIHVQLRRHPHNRSTTSIPGLTQSIVDGRKFEHVSEDARMH